VGGRTFPLLLKNAGGLLFFRSHVDVEPSKVEIFGKLLSNRRVSDVAMEFLGDSGGRFNEFYGNPSLQQPF